MRLKQGTRELNSMRWGLVPWFAKDTKGAARMINAQSETVDVKPAFRDAWQKGRADGFYEWPEPKRPRFITLKHNAPFAFAGLWDIWGQEKLKTFTILTTTPNEFMTEVHNRMPVMLAPETWSTWLGENSATSPELKALCVPFPPCRWSPGRSIPASERRAVAHRSGTTRPAQLMRRSYEISGARTSKFCSVSFLSPDQISSVQMPATRSDGDSSDMVMT